MTKTELISQMAKDAGITKAQAADAYASFTENITKTLKKGEKATLIGFGTFSTSKRAARTARNPRTNEPIKVKARTVAKFKPGKALADAVNKK
ncbi:MAG TPA: HU family DNA-binding protein [Chitinophagaceae bacterium]|nr:HU family DNA-binding protein [Chitinophagaceae bacterium]